MFDLNQLLTDNIQYLRLDILPSVQEKAWQQAQNHSNAIARHNSYLNYVSLYTLLDWFTDELTEAETISKPEIYPSENSLPSIWEVVNGAAIKLSEKRIVLIPCEISDLEEFSVPQEWVDIPEWAGDYYLAIQVNLEPEEDECWLEVCGFTTHRYLKNLGKYNHNERTYAMTLDNLIQDIAVMEITLPLKMQQEIPDLPNLSEFEAKKWLDFFGNSSIYSPRLRVNDVTFEEWAALMVNDLWRQQLYEQRMGLVTLSSLVAGNVPTASEAIASSSVIQVPQSVRISNNIDSILAWIKTTLEKMCDFVEPIPDDDAAILVPGFRNTASPIAYEGIKEINLVTATGRHLLRVTKVLEVDNYSGLINVCIEVSSTEPHIPLPPALQIQALNKDNITLKSHGTEYDNDLPILDLDFTRKFGEPFSIKLILSGEEIQTFEYK